MALEPGRTPLPGSPPLQDATTLTDTSETNKVVAETSKPSDGQSLTRLSLFAKPNEGITTTGTGGTNTDRPLRDALGNVHPVRDVVTAVSGTVKKVLGNDDTAASDTSTSASN